MSNRIIGRKQIPQAFLDAFHEAYNNDDLFLDEAMAVALSAWPDIVLLETVPLHSLLLPLPQEARDD
jgi:hypothetical protein